MECACSRTVSSRADSKPIVLIIDAIYGPLLLHPYMGLVLSVTVAAISHIRQSNSSRQLLLNEGSVACMQLLSTGQRCGMRRLRSVYWLWLMRGLIEGDYYSCGSEWLISQSTCEWAEKLAVTRLH